MPRRNTKRTKAWSGWFEIPCPTCYATRKELCRVLDRDGLPTGNHKTSPHRERVDRALSGGQK